MSRLTQALFAHQMEAGLLEGFNMLLIIDAVCCEQEVDGARW